MAVRAMNASSEWVFGQSQTFCIANVVSATAIRAALASWRHATIAAQPSIVMTGSSARMW